MDHMGTLPEKKIAPGNRWFGSMQIPSNSFWNGFLEGAMLGFSFRTQIDSEQMKL